MLVLGISLISLAASSTTRLELEEVQRALRDLDAPRAERLLRPHKNNLSRQDWEILKARTEEVYIRAERKLDNMGKLHDMSYGVMIGEATMLPLFAVARHFFY